MKVNKAILYSYDNSIGSSSSVLIHLSQSSRVSSISGVSSSPVISIVGRAGLFVLGGGAVVCVRACVHVCVSVRACMCLSVRVCGVCPSLLLRIAVCRGAFSLGTPSGTSPSLSTSSLSVSQFVCVTLLYICAHATCSSSW